MNDLLAEMASDSEATPDKIDQLQEGKLDSVSRLANEAATLERELADAEKLSIPANNTMRNTANFFIILP